MNRVIKKKDGVINKTFVYMMEELEYDIELIYVKKEAEKFDAGNECIGDLITIITDFFEERQDLYDKIANTIIPVIVYSGDEATLPEIFDRINSKGTPLDKYEIYAAAWSINEKYTISNTRIVEYVIAKYDAFVSDGYKIHGYNREDMRVTKKVTAFEICSD